MSKLIVVGGGPMGLAAAYFAARAGHAVTIVEAEDRVGGMAGHFDFGGLSIERFYHFCCRGDDHTLRLMADLGIASAMEWVRPRMGFFVDGALRPFGDPVSLLGFPGLSLVDKIRYGLMAAWSLGRSKWGDLDGMSARTWLTRWCGARAYDRLWRPLLDLKFFEFADRVSAAWIWRRIKRLGESRGAMGATELGYIRGGSSTLVESLQAAIRLEGGVVRCGAPVSEILVERGAARGVRLASGEVLTADGVICTAPLPAASRMLERSAPDLAALYAGFANIGVVCVIHKLARPVSPYFWVNISDPDIQIPGIVEFSNLRPLDRAIIYVPYYMPTDHEKFSWTDEALISESFGYLQKLNPDLTPADRIDARVGRLRHAQPICDVGFATRIPPVTSSVRGLYVADTCFYYPEDRGLSESIGFAKHIVASIDGATDP